MVMRTSVVVVAGLSLAVLAGAYASPVRAEGRGLHVGVQVGFSPSVWFYDAASGGVEIGWQVSTRFGLRADVSAGAATFKSNTTSDIYASASERRYASLPVCLSLLHVLPVSEAVMAYIGAGAGFYALTIRDILTEEGSYANSKRTETSQKISGIAPHLNIGLESRLSKTLTIFGEVRESIGRKTVEIQDGAFRREEAIQFGGVQLKAGIRLYFR
jgi:hypothetical protein